VVFTTQVVKVPNPGVRASRATLQDSRRTGRAAARARVHAVPIRARSFRMRAIEFGHANCHFPQ
jgi:hypothetical protein